MAKKKEDTVVEAKTGKLSRADRLAKIKELASVVQSKLKNDEVIGTMDMVKKVETVSSGSMSADIALGGGYPVGRIIELFGAESSGKTTMTLHAIAEQQKAGVICAFVDAEHALDPKYAKAVGVNVDELLISQPDSGEEALEVVQALIESGEVGCIVVDSVSALTPKAELEGEMDKLQVGLQARMMAKGLRKIGAIANRNNCTVFFINQLRMKIGVMFGNPETTSGGNALKFYASQRIRMGSGKKEKDSSTGQLLAGTFKLVVRKNKIAPPFQEAEFPIVAGSGIDAVGDLITVAKKLFKEVKGPEDGPMKIAGGHMYLYDVGLEKDKLASNGREAMDKLKADPKLLKHVEKIVRDKFNSLKG